MLKKKYESQDWHSVHIPMWKEHLAPLLDGRRVNGLEIGSYEGRSSCWILENMMKHPLSHLVCVDPWDGRHDIEGLKTVEARSLFQVNVDEWGDKVTALKMDSYQAFPLIQGRPQNLMIQNEFDFIYIDGCHEGITVLHDLLMSWRLLREGGFLVADDMRWHGKDIRISPRTAWSCFMAMDPPGLHLLHHHRQAIMRKVS